MNAKFVRNAGVVVKLLKSSGRELELGKVEDI